MFCRGKNQKLELFRDFSNFLSGSAKENVIQCPWHCDCQNEVAGRADGMIPSIVLTALP